jgi:hypothetical protein
MVQAWYQAWYRHGAGMVQAWYRHGTNEKLMEAGGKMYRKLKFCLDSVGNPHFYFRNENLYSESRQSGRNFKNNEVLSSYT